MRAERLNLRLTTGTPAEDRRRTSVVSGIRQQFNEYNVRSRLLHAQVEPSSL